jgi:hypothetical protein
MAAPVRNEYGASDLPKCLQNERKHRAGAATTRIQTGVSIYAGERLPSPFKMNRGHLKMKDTTVSQRKMDR